MSGVALFALLVLANACFFVVGLMVGSFMTHQWYAKKPKEPTP